MPSVIVHPLAWVYIYIWMRQNQMLSESVAKKGQVNIWVKSCMDSFWLQGLFGKWHWFEREHEVHVFNVLWLWYRNGFDGDTRWATVIFIVHYSILRMLKTKSLFPCYLHMQLQQSCTQHRPLLHRQQRRWAIPIQSNFILRPQGQVLRIIPICLEWNSIPSNKRERRWQPRAPF